MTTPFSSSGEGSAPINWKSLSKDTRSEADNETALNSIMNDGVDYYDNYDAHDDDYENDDS